MALLKPFPKSYAGPFGENFEGWVSDSDTDLGEFVLDVGISVEVWFWGSAEERVIVMRMRRVIVSGKFILFI